LDRFPIEKLTALVQKVLPIVYDDTLTIYELMGKVTAKVNEVIESVNAYFDEDIETVIGNILLDWYDSGKLGEIINQTLFDSKADKSYVDQTLSTTLQYIDEKFYLMDDELHGLESEVHSFHINVKENYNVLGDGVTDDTLEIQRALDELPDGGLLFFPKGTYLVSKNTLLPDFPQNDQPCLLLRGKKHVALMGQGAVFKVNVHAQGILETQLCSDVEIKGLKFEGYGSFPAIDPISGYGEKGSTAGGYNTAGFWSYYKNNSYDTTERIFTGGGTWGSFGGGYIGNISYGLFIHRECERINVKCCEAYGFNYSGFGVGGNVNNVPENLNYGDSSHIHFEKCYGHDNYSSNFDTCKSEFVTFKDCFSKDSGHPDASKEHTYVDPGYGYQLKGSIFGLAKHTTIRDCVSINDKRKGIDAHAGRGFTCEDNVIIGSWINGISYASTDPQQLATDYNISHNSIYNVGAGKNPGAPISVGGLNKTNYTKANALALGKIKDNLIKDCFSVYGLIHVDTFDILHVTGNQIVGVMPEADRTGRVNASGPYGIYFGYSTPDELNYMGVCANNIIDSDGSPDMIGGIIARNIDAGHVSGNLVKLVNDTADFGIRVWASDRLNVNNNSVILGNVGLAYDLTTNGSILGNQSVGGSSQDTPLMGVTIGVRLSYLDGVETQTWFSGKQFVESIVDDVNGVRFNLINVPNGIKPSASIKPAADNGLSSVSTWADYLYVRQVSAAYVVFGTRAARNGTRITYDNYYNGGIDIEITI
jgi:hypothetical protein